MDRDRRERGYGGGLGYGEGYGRDFGGGYGGGFDGSWGQGYGGSLGASDYRASFGGEDYGGGFAGGDYDRSFGPRGGGFQGGRSDESPYGAAYGGGPDQGGGSFGGHRGRAAYATGDDRSQGPHRGRGPQSYRRSDELIREEVNERLADDPHLDASGIQIRVENGEVTLDGDVPSREDRRRAEVLIELTRGVTHVQNNLRTPTSIGPADGRGLYPSTGVNPQDYQ